MFKVLNICKGARTFWVGPEGKTIEFVRASVFFMLKLRSRCVKILIFARAFAFFVGKFVDKAKSAADPTTRTSVMLAIMLAPPESY